MGEIAKNLLFSSSLILGVLSSSLCFVCFLSFGFSPFLVSSLIVTLSTIFLLTFTKKKKVLDENPTGNFPSSQTVLLDENKLQPKLETAQEELQEKLSESDEDEQLIEMCSNNVGLSPEISDDSSFSDDDDDDSLIEIILPGNLSCSVEEEKKQKLQPSLPDFLPESIFRENGLKELLADITEEDNLIEIDISMGSIKCPRFEIEA
ncbi:hypothetical protein UlMin_003853 [Ulmus minor]